MCVCPLNDVLINMDCQYKVMHFIFILLIVHLLAMTKDSDKDSDKYVMHVI